jgi:peptidylprolyl isomerase|tara:strand:- start:197 stop:625 length:429 start_codon:yes stop_codon:yes gene_type:complete
MSTVENGNTVSVHYRGTLNDGTEFDSSHSRDEALTFQVGTGQMIPGFDTALVGMNVGETKNVTLTPDQAYGDVNADAFADIPKTSFPDDFVYTEGAMIQGMGPNGPVVGTITEVNETDVNVNFNHPMAGKDLNFEIELLEIQ